MSGRRPLQELVDTADPAWPLVLEWLRTGRNAHEVLPTPRPQGEAVLLALQVTTRSPLGAIALETGGIIVDGGWLRLLGAGGERMRGSLCTWNGLDGPPPEPRLHGGLVVAHDALGGFFVLDGGGLGAATRGVVYAAPDDLEWLDLGLGYAEFVHWAAHGDLAAFYADVRWPGWEADVGTLDPDRGLACWPPLFTEEGQAARLDRSSRGDVPLRELWGLWHDSRSQLGTTGPPPPP